MAFVVAALGAPAASAADAPEQIRVYADGVAQTFEYAAIHGQEDTTGANGQSGWSVATLIQIAGANPNRAEVMAGTEDSNFPLSERDLNSPSFQHGLVPMVWDNPPYFEAELPPQPDGTGGQGPILGRVISIFAHSSGPLAEGPSAQAVGGGTFAPGTDITLKAAGSCPGGAAPTVSWIFDLDDLGAGAAAGEGMTTTHRYPADKTYYGAADMECGGGVGGAAFFSVTINAAGAGPGPGATATATPTAGPKATPTPSQTKTPRRTPTPTATPKRGGSGTGGNTPTATATAAPSAAPSATAAPTLAPTPAVTPNPTTQASATPTATSTPAPTPAATPSNLPTVSGRLVSAIVPVPVQDLVAPAPAPASARSGGVVSPAPPQLAVPIGLLAVLALGFAGAWRERRSL